MELSKQYKTPINLEVRIKLHELYSTNKIDWHEWMFNHIQTSENANIVEFGCGNGTLWHKNLRNVPEHWQITLTDLSSGMLKRAEGSLQHMNQFCFRNVNIQDTNFDTEQFDIAIANHMLYHVEDRGKALSEVNRILKPEGKFYASTNGENHMKEIYELVNEFNPNIDFEKFNHNNFGLRNGYEQLSPHFPKVRLIQYESGLDIDNVVDLANYILSMSTSVRDSLDAQYDDFIDFLESKKNQAGIIEITKETGLFICSK